jgi:YHS domain-containing protein
MKTIDPVCGMALESAMAAVTEVWKGQTYYFCSESCHTQFRAAPDRYAKTVNQKNPPV